MIKSATYNPEFGFNTWLITIAKNVHIDMLRKKKSTLFLEITDEEDSLANQVLDDTPTVEDTINYRTKFIEITTTNQTIKTCVSRSYSIALFSRNDVSRYGRTIK